MALQHETLFLACTRPAMRWGVPMEAWYLNLLGTFLLGMILGSPIYWIVWGPFHLLFRGLARWEPNFFGILRVWAETKGRAFGVAIFGGSTLLALPPPDHRSAIMVTCV